MYLSRALLVPKLRRLEFTREARGQGEPFTGLQELKQTVYISWWWCGECLVERMGGKPVRKLDSGETLMDSKAKKVRSTRAWGLAGCVS